MNEKFEQIRKSAKEKIEEVKNLQELQELKAKYLGKKGEVTIMLKGLGEMLPEERRAFGQKVNELREDIETHFKNYEAEIKEQILKQKLESEKIDITLPSTKITRGSKSGRERN